MARRGSEARPEGGSRRASASLMDTFKDTAVHALHDQADDLLKSQNMRQAIKRPYSVDENKWIAYQTVAIFDDVVMCIGWLDDWCNHQTCPRMKADKGMSYYFKDEQTGESLKLSAPDYMQEVILSAEATLSDRRLVPADDGEPFPPEFMPKMRKLYKDVFRVYAHAYLHHFRDFRDAGAETYFNWCFKRLVYVALEFRLLEKTDMIPLKDLINAFLERDWSKDRQS